MAESSRLLRWTVAVLASAWFFPVSCTSTLFVATHMLARADERDASRGDAAHAAMPVVAVPAEKPGLPFSVLELRSVAEFCKQKPDASFFMPAKEGQLQVASVSVTYKVVSATATEQVIEVEYRDDDRSAWGRYRATQREVTPLASRLWHSGYMMRAIPWALGVALLLYIGAGFAQQRRQRKAEHPA